MPYFFCHCTDTGSSGKAHCMAFFLIPAQNNLLALSNTNRFPQG